MRFGIEMTSDHTLEEVGKQFDVTRERIRQIEAMGYGLSFGSGLHVVRQARPKRKAGGS